MSHNEIKKAILKSQHCQRNFDLEPSFTAEDIELLKTAVSQCPSKQNVAFYKAHFIFDRIIIKQIHEQTRGFILKPELGDDSPKQTNSQTLANLLVVFEKINPKKANEGKDYRSIHFDKFANGSANEDDLKILNKDALLAVGIAAGYINLTAALLGYCTGCCSCFNSPGIMTNSWEEKGRFF